MTQRPAVPVAPRRQWQTFSRRWRAGSRLEVFVLASAIAHLGATLLVALPAARHREQVEQEELVATERREKQEAEEKAKKEEIAAAAVEKTRTLLRSEVARAQLQRLFGELVEGFLTDEMADEFWDGLSDELEPELEELAGMLEEGFDPAELEAKVQELKEDLVQALTDRIAREQAAPIRDELEKKTADQAAQLAEFFDREIAAKVGRPAGDQLRQLLAQAEAARRKALEGVDADLAAAAKSANDAAKALEQSATKLDAQAQALDAAGKAGDAAAEKKAQTATKGEQTALAAAGKQTTAARDAARRAAERLAGDDPADRAAQDLKSSDEKSGTAAADGTRAATEAAGNAQAGDAANKARAAAADLKQLAAAAEAGRAEVRRRLQPDSPQAAELARALQNVADGPLAEQVAAGFAKLRDEKLVPAVVQRAVQAAEKQLRGDAQTLDKIKGDLRRDLEKSLGESLQRDVRAGERFADGAGKIDPAKTAGPDAKSPNDAKTPGNTKTPGDAKPANDTKPGTETKPGPDAKPGTDTKTPAGTQTATAPGTASKTNGAQTTQAGATTGPQSTASTTSGANTPTGANTPAGTNAAPASKATAAATTAAGTKLSPSVEKSLAALVDAGLRALPAPTLTKPTEDAQRQAELANRLAALKAQLAVGRRDFLGGTDTAQLAAARRRMQDRKQGLSSLRRSGLRMDVEAYKKAAETMAERGRIEGEEFARRGAEGDVSRGEADPLLRPALVGLPAPESQTAPDEKPTVRSVASPSFPTNAFAGIPFLTDDAIAIDGDLDDWKDVPELTLFPVHVGTGSKSDSVPEAQIAKVAYCPRGILIAVEAVDTSGKLENHHGLGQFWFNDCLEIFLDTINSKYSTRGEVNTHQFFAFPVGQKDQPDFGGYESYMVRGEEMTPRAHSRDVLPRAGKAAPDGKSWRMELLIPKTLLRQGEVRPGRIVGFNLQLDTGTSWYYFWSNPVKGRISVRPNLWGDVQFLGSDAKLEILDAAGDPLRALVPGGSVRVRVADPDMNLDDAARDKVGVVLRAASGDDETMILEETGERTGVFEGTLPVRLNIGRSQPGALEVFEGEKVHVEYVDQARAYGERNVPVATRLPVGAIGTRLVGGK